MDIKETHQKLLICTVLQQYGLQPSRKKMVCFPFYDDKNPIMPVYADTNTAFYFSVQIPLIKQIFRIEYLFKDDNKANYLLCETDKVVLFKYPIMLQRLAELHKVNNTEKSHILLELVGFIKYVNYKNIATRL